MSEPAQTGKTCDLRGIREAVCVHTGKITDSCLAKDCIEDLRVYLTVDSQQTLDCAASAKARYVELLFTQVQVEPVPYSSGYFTVDVTFYYRVIADATLSAGRTNTVTGLAVFSKRLVLFGGETSARIFSSRDDLTCLCKKSLQSVSLPRAIAETVDPIILGSRVMEACSCCCQNEASPAIPEALLGCFDEPLVLDRRMQAPACHDWTVLHRPARTRHAAAHPDVRLLRSVEDLPAGGRHEHGKPLRGLQPDRFPDGRVLPREKRTVHQARRQLHRLQQNQISNRAPAAVRQPGHSFFVEASGRGRRLCLPDKCCEFAANSRKSTVFCGRTESSAPTQCSHEFALGFRFSQLSAARPLRHSAADAVQTGEVFFEVAGGREGEIEGHAVALVGQAGLRQGFAEAADGQRG